MSSSFTERLIRAQQAIGTISRDATNPRFGSRYATLDAIIEQVRPALAAQGLLLTQHVVSKDNYDQLTDCVTTRISDDDNEITSSVSVPAHAEDPQRFGAALTYARRYGIATLLCLATEDDDDGNAAQPLAAAPRTTAPPTRAAQPAAAPTSASGTAPEGDDRHLDRLRAVEVHFGKNRGSTLGALTLRSLSWYATEWEPRFDERTGRLNATDEALKLAARQLLDAMLHPGQATYVPADVAPAVIADEADGIPFL